MNERSISRRTFIIAGVSFSALFLGSTLLGCSTAKAIGDSSVSASEEQSESTHKVVLHRGYGAAHGDKCFTQIAVATAEDGTVLAANIDDYQYLSADTAGVIPVPNSDGAFAAGYAPGMVLVSKSFSDEAYSKMMAEKAGSTQSWLTSMQAIEAAAAGQEPKSLTKIGVDAISGATLVDAPKYLAAVAEVAQNNDIIAEGTYTGDGSD
ncbi:MAG: TAT pathway signal sequence, partial [Raoultibacter sp.]